jgi:hypothetical protein
MKVIVYTTDGDVPASMKACARILLDGKQGLHPVVFMGVNAESVGAMAATWWSDQMATIAAREEAKARRAEALRTGRVKPEAAA